MLEERLKQQALIQKSSLPPNACHRYEIALNHLFSVLVKLIVFLNGAYF